MMQIPGGEAHGAGEPLCGSFRSKWQMRRGRPSHRLVTVSPNPDDQEVISFAEHGEGNSQVGRAHACTPYFQRRNNPAFRRVLPGTPIWKSPPPCSASEIAAWALVLGRTVTRAPKSSLRHGFPQHCKGTSLIRNTHPHRITTGP